MEINGGKKRLRPSGITPLPDTHSITAILNLASYIVNRKNCIRAFKKMHLVRTEKKSHPQISRIIRACRNDEAAMLRNARFRMGVTFTRRHGGRSRAIGG